LLTHSGGSRILSWGTVEGRGLGRGHCPLSRKKNLPEKGGFWCILGLLFYVYAKIDQVNGAAAALNPPPP